MAAPWFKIYASELLGKTETLLLTDDQMGKLVRLWAYASMDGCTIPANPEAIGKLLRIQNKNQMVNQMVWIKQFFRPVEGSPDRLVSARLLREQDAYEAKCAKLKANGSRGGRPKKPDGLAFAEPSGSANENQMPPEVEGKGIEKEKDVEPPAETPTRQPRKVAVKKPAADSLPEILGKGTLTSLWEDFWLLSGIWPETSNIRKKDSARAYVEARKNASHECIFAWAEWTLEQSGGKITTLSAWLSNQDWQGRQDQRSRLAVSA